LLKNVTNVLKLYDRQRYCKSFLWQSGFICGVRTTINDFFPLTALTLVERLQVSRR